MSKRSDAGYVVKPVFGSQERTGDRFEIKNLPFHPQTSLEVYDRWGRKVYDQEPYSNNWPQEKTKPGTYFYWLRAEKTSYKGWIELDE